MNSIKQNIKQTALLFLLSVFSLCVFSRSDLTQTVRGQIDYTDTKNPIIGATIVVDETVPLIKTVTDLDGNFRSEGVPPGRKNFTATYAGYESYRNSKVLVGSGNEVVFIIELKESVLILK